MVTSLLSLCHVCPLRHKASERHQTRPSAFNGTMVSCPPRKSCPPSLFSIFQTSYCLIAFKGYHELWALCFLQVQTMGVIHVVQPATVACHLSFKGDLTAVLHGIIITSKGLLCPPCQGSRVAFREAVSSNLAIQAFQGCRTVLPVHRLFVSYCPSSFRVLVSYSHSSISRVMKRKGITPLLGSEGITLPSRARRMKGFGGVKNA